MRIATYASVFVAILLILVKAYAWLVTDSISLLSSLVDSFLDAFISVINLWAVHYALQPPDEDHRFGHSGAEDVAALAQSAFVAGSSIFIAIAALERLLNPEVITHSMVGIAVMLFSIVATFGLVLFQKYVVKKTGSTAVHADSLHYVGDLLMNASVICAIILAHYFEWQYADPVFGLAIAAYIFKNAWHIGKLAFDKLMDKEFNDEERQKIIDVINAHPGTLGMHALKTRHSGIKPFIQFHLELDGNQTLQEAHKIADSLEKKLTALFPGGEVIIHEDPIQK